MKQIEIMSAGKKELFLGILGFVEFLTFIIISIYFVIEVNEWGVFFVIQFVTIITLIQGILGITCWRNRKQFSIYYEPFSGSVDFDKISKDYIIEDTSAYGVLYIKKEHKQEAADYKCFNILKSNQFKELSN